MNKFKVVLIANDNHPIPAWVTEKYSAAGIQYEHHECFCRADLATYAYDADVLWLMSSRKGLIIEANMDVFIKAGAVI
ncbi:MAG: hypothetical protein Q7J78_00420, partial [Clostridiales bacterium]|nr:hypothetical protein [Clostridiales bacterium]